MLFLVTLVHPPELCFGRKEYNEEGKRWFTDMKIGEIKEFGWFLDGKSGYAIGEGESVTVIKDVSMFMPFEEFKVQEIVPWEKGKAAVREAWKILAATM